MPIKLIRKSPYTFAGCVVAGTLLLLVYLDKTQDVPPSVKSVVNPLTTDADASVLPAIPESSPDEPVPKERKLSSIGPLPSLRLTPRASAIQAAPLLPPQPRAIEPNTPRLALAPFRSGSMPNRNLDKPSESAETHSSNGDNPMTTSLASESKPAEITVALGAGLDKLPRWQGSRKTEVRRVPYIDINWQDRIELSTVKGLTIDLLHGEKWHGGLIGTMVWGRSGKDLDGLKVPTLINTLQGGLYLEYAVTPAFSLGIRLRHDIQNTGVSYAEAYAELELPKIGYLEHDIHISQEAMNRAGMHRFFGLSAQDASRLGVSAYTPRAGLNKTSITYEGFHPTSESTGFVFGATIGRLNSEAANSPLVKNFGAAIQREFFGAFLYHF